MKFQLSAFRRSKLEIIGLILIATFLSLNSTPGEGWGSEYGKRIQKRDISIADVRVTAIGLTGANLEIVFNIRNRSGIPATLDQLDYKLYGNNIYLGESKINDAISVPAHSNKIVSSSFILNYSSVDKIGRDDLAKGTINWKISVDLGPGLTDEERPEDITVKAKEGAKPTPTIETATLTSSESSGNDPCSQATSLDYPVPKALYLSNIGVDYKHGYEFWHSVSGYGHHLGEDIKLPEGMPVEAIGNGKIAYYGAATSYGELVVAIEHDLGKEYEFTNGLEEIVSTQKILSIYGHLRKSEERGGSLLRWKVGDCVSKGEIIGYVNDAEHNGVPTKEHLHMAIRLSDKSAAWRRDGNYWLRGYDRDKKTKCGPKCGEDFAALSGVIEKLVEAKLPPVLTSPLKISPSAPYHAGDRINAEFTITNKGTVPITFNILTAGGRDPDGQVADFTFRRDITLSPNKSYDYKGSLTLAKAGNYHFFCAYQTPDGKWNPSVDLRSGLTDEDRIEDITVKVKEETKPTLVKASSGPEVIWSRIFFPDGGGMLNYVEQTSDGGYILAGRSGGWLVKTDPSGQTIWKRRLKYESDYVRKGMRYHGYIITHSVQQTTDGGYILAREGGEVDGVQLIKTDAFGRKIWERVSENKARYSPPLAQQTSDGGYILAGSTRLDSREGQPWLMKTDPQGDRQWERTFEERGYVHCLQQTMDGGYILANGGWEWGGTKKSNIWLIKTDASGQKIWKKTFGEKAVISLQQTPDGGHILVGSNGSRLDSGELQPWLWLTKIDSKGDKQWERRFKLEEGRYPYLRSSFQQTTDGGYILAGYIVVDSDKLQPWLMKTDSKGEKQWERRFKIGEGYVSCVQQTSDGGYILVAAEHVLIKLGSIKPAPKKQVTEVSKKSKNYYPLNEGKSWEYQVFLKEEFQGSGKMVMTNLPPRELKGKKVTPQREEIEIVSPIIGSQSYTTFSFIAEDQTGIYEFASQRPEQVELEIKTPLSYLIKYPIKVGTGWWVKETSAFEPKISISVKVTIESIDEVVTVPAGTFKECLKIKGTGFTEEKLDDNSKVEREMEFYFWYAPNVGLIKMIGKEKRTRSGGWVPTEDSRQMAIQLKTFK